MRQMYQRKMNLLYLIKKKNLIDEMFEDVVDEIEGETSDSDTSESSYQEQDDSTDYDELGDVPVERKTQSGK